MNNNNKPKNQKHPRELIGKITDKVSAKAYSHKKECSAQCVKGCHYGNTYYKLTIECENKPEVKQIMVFKDLLANEQIWNDILEVKYYHKTYAFSCSQWMSIYRLVDWKEINVS